MLVSRKLKKITDYELTCYLYIASQFCQRPQHDPIGNVEVYNTGPAGYASCTQWLIVKTAIKSLCF